VVEVEEEVEKEGGAFLVFSCSLSNSLCKNKQTLSHVDRLAHLARGKSQMVPK